MSKKKINTATISSKGKMFPLTFSKEILNSFSFIRITAVVLMFALLAPICYFGDFGKAKAQTRVPVQQPAPVSEPPEPYLVEMVQ